MLAHEIRFVKSKMAFMHPLTGEKMGVPFTGNALLVYRPVIRPAASPRVSSYAQK